jgi:hypothetical protein
MLREATYPPAAVNVLDVSSESMAAFQVFIYGRFWVFTEELVTSLKSICWNAFGFSERLTDMRAVQRAIQLAG